MVLVQQAKETARDGRDEPEALLRVAFPAQGLGSGVNDHLTLKTAVLTTVVATRRPTSARLSQVPMRTLSASLKMSSPGLSSVIGARGREVGCRRRTGAHNSHRDALGSEGRDGLFGSAHLVRGPFWTRIPGLAGVSGVG